MGKDIADGEAMTYVISQLDKPPSTETEERLGRTNTSAMSESDLTKRNNQVIEQSHIIGVKKVCDGKDIVKGNPKVNTLFVAEVFNTRHGLEITEEEQQLIEKFGNDYDDIEGSREERAFRLWINSLGIESVFITNLYDEARTGYVFLEVCDKIKPGSVDWSKVVGPEEKHGHKK